jgi:hypothetical protein
MPRKPVWARVAKRNILVTFRAPRPAEPAHVTREGISRGAPDRLRASGPPSSAEPPSGPRRTLPHQIPDGRRADHQRGAKRSQTRDAPPREPTQDAFTASPSQSSPPAASRDGRRRTADGGRRTAESSRTSSSVDTDPSSQLEAHPRIGQQSRFQGVARRPGMAGDFGKGEVGTPAAANGTTPWPPPQAGLGPAIRSRGGRGRDRRRASDGERGRTGPGGRGCRARARSPGERRCRSP